MAVEAAREALRSGATVDSLLFATTSPAYAEKLDASTIHTALDLRSGMLAASMGGSTRSGITSLLVAAGMADAGREVLVTASDVVVGGPGGARESLGGDGAVAFIVGPDRDAGARILGYASVTGEVMDVWRSPESPFASQWEERFGMEVLLPLMQDAATKALKSAGVAPDTLTKVIIDSTNRRAAAAIGRGFRLKPEQMADDLSNDIGRTGAAHAGLMLARALDDARPGDRIAIVVGADGADACILEVTGAIDSVRPRRSVAHWTESKRNDLPYTSYLKWRGILPFEPPRRPNPRRPEAPPMRRSERWKYAFVGSRCKACGTANLPPQRICIQCRALDQMEAEPFADASGRIATYTLDRVGYTLQPPIIAAVVDFEKGGRFSCQLTDVDPNKIAIGDELEMTFRRLYVADGVHNYFWKARPKR
jgi:3-hydroxy-3-methylglutaryl CoA synthase